MACEHFSITIDDKEAKDLYPDLMSYEIEIDEELAAMFRLKIAIARQPDGTWTHLRDPEYQVWRPISLKVGLGDSMEEIMSGYITHVKPTFSPNLSQCTLEVWGMDETVLMDREDKLKTWPNKTDSDIATEIFNQYKLKPEVEPTKIVHDEAISTTIQRETDIQFLRRLARRNGYECYVEGKTGYFRSPKLTAPPQPVLAAHFDDETNIKQISLNVNALTPANIAMFQLDRTTKKVLDLTTTASQQEPLGATPANGLLLSGMQAGVAIVNGVATIGLPEMTTLCQGVYDQGSWFITAEGEIAANDYGHVLRARQPVTIKGIGEPYSGIYYVTHVTHILSPDGYQQKFRAKRNALMPTGNEKFAA